MSAMSHEWSCFPSTASFVAFCALQGSVLVLVVYYVCVLLAKAQEGRKKNQCRGNKGDARDELTLGKSRCPGPTCPSPCSGMPHPLTLSPLPAAPVPTEASRPLETPCHHVRPEMDALCETIRQFNRIATDLIRHLDMLNRVIADSCDSSWTSITTSEASSSAEGSLCPSTHSSLTSTAASNVCSSSWECLSTLADEAERPPASRVQPGLGHPSPGPEEQPGLTTRSPCCEEVDICLKAGGVRQLQQDLEIHLGASTASPEVPELHSREMETPLTCHKGHKAREGSTLALELEWEPGVPASVDEASEGVPASAPPSPQQPKKREVMVVPTVPDPPFLDEDEKRQLEQLIEKMKIQRRFGLQTSVQEWDLSFAYHGS